MIANRPSPKLLCLIVSAVLLCSCSSRHEQNPLSPEEALKSFQLDPDFRIEIFASEPHVVDPVEMAFDEKGRVFVAEMIDYPYDPPQGQPPKSRIRLLEDTDGDGRIDRSTVFADKLLQVTSIQPWKGGILVTAAPDIIYLKDTDGDNKADMRKVLLTGFAKDVDPESRITNLRFCVDNWIYAANNGQRGQIKFMERPDAPEVSVLGADFRFRLDRGLFEAESGPTQFGLAMDDWGHRFITQNTIHVRHVVVPRRYLSRNPFLAAGQAAHDISDHDLRVFQLTPPQRWRQMRTMMRQQRYKELNLDLTEQASGYFTGASGGTIYLGDTFPERYRGNLFTGDVACNIVHRDVLRPEGATFLASRADEEKDREFLASTDQWFRPCNFANGPDGNLYVVDMYREFIETPASIPEELKKDMDFSSGSDKGRIYRIAPKNAPKTRMPRFDLTKVETSELVRLLSHPNGWWRLTAQRLILERQDKSVVPLLKSMVAEGRSPQARLHALYALEGLSSLDSNLVKTALKDAHPCVREHAVRLAENFPELADKLAGMIDDPSPHVLFQLALSLGEFSGEKIQMALAKLASRHAQDRWFRVAILSSKAGSSVSLLERMLAERNFFLKPDSGKERFVQDLASVIGARNDLGEMARLISLLSNAKLLRAEGWQIAALEGLALGLKMAGAYRLKLPQADVVMGRLLASPSEKVQSAARAVAQHLELSGLIRASMRQALDNRLTVAKRKMAIQSLAGAPFGRVRAVYEKLLGSELDQELLQAAMRSLGSYDDPEVGRLIVSRWKTFSPAVRESALDVLVGHKRRVPVLLEALENGEIEPSALDLPRKEKLLRNPDARISERARRIFHDQAGDRSQVLESYRSALSLKGDERRGRVIFEKNCAVCHLSRNGRRVGPDLGSVKGQTKEQLLQSILDPSRNIEPAYTNYVIVTKDGRIHDGIIVAETPGTLTLRRGEEDETILRSNVVEIRASSVSLMPDGLEANMSKQDVADLIAFLQGGRLHEHGR